MILIALLLTQWVTLEEAMIMFCHDTPSSTADDHDGGSGGGNNPQDPSTPRPTQTQAQNKGDSTAEAGKRDEKPLYGGAAAAGVACAGAGGAALAKCCCDNGRGASQGQNRSSKKKKSKREDDSEDVRNKPEKLGETYL